MAPKNVVYTKRGKSKLFALSYLLTNQYTDAYMDLVNVPPSIKTPTPSFRATRGRVNPNVITSFQFDEERTLIESPTRTTSSIKNGSSSSSKSTTVSGSGLT